MGPVSFPIAISALLAKEQRSCIVVLLTKFIHPFVFNEIKFPIFISSKLPNRIGVIFF